MKYYLHDTNARNDEKITLIYIEYGYEGVGLFYSILEVLASQEKPVSENVLKSQLGIKKRLEKLLAFMYKIEILSLRNGEVFNENILNFSEKYQIKKEKARQKIAEWRDKQVDKKNVTGYVPICNDPKVKERKVKESKIIYPQGFELIISDWLEYKKEKKQSYKPKGLETFIKQLLNYSDNSPEIARQIIDKSMASNYTGIFEPNNKPKKIEKSTEIDYDKPF